MMLALRFNARLSRYLATSQSLEFYQLKRVQCTIREIIKIWWQRVTAQTILLRTLVWYQAITSLIIWNLQAKYRRYENLDDTDFNTIEADSNYWGLTELPLRSQQLQHHQLQQRLSQQHQLTRDNDGVYDDKINVQPHQQPIKLTLLAVPFTKT